MGEYRDGNRNIRGRDMSAALAIHDTLKRELPAIVRQIREPAKVIQFKVGVSKRTVEAVRQAEHVISAAALLELARVYPSVKALVLRVIGETESDPAKLIEQIRKMVSA